MSLTHPTVSTLNDGRLAKELLILVGSFVSSVCAEFQLSFHSFAQFAPCHGFWLFAPPIKISQKCARPKLG